VLFVVKGFSRNQTQKPFIDKNVIHCLRINSGPDVLETWNIFNMIFKSARKRCACIILVGELVRRPLKKQNMGGRKILRWISCLMKEAVLFSETVHFCSVLARLIVWEDFFNFYSLWNPQLSKGQWGPFAWEAKKGKSVITSPQFHAHCNLNKVSWMPRRRSTGHEIWWEDNVRVRRPVLSFFFLLRLRTNSGQNIFCCICHIFLHRHRAQNREWQV
jgi:hypothetical protein